MRKWGHKEGTGLGAHGTGIVHALTAEHVVKPNDPSHPLSKRQLAKQKAAAANAKNRKWTQSASSRGRIVNANEDERQREEKDRLGEASRVVCLIGLVTGVDDVDEDLSDEIGEECSKWGWVTGLRMTGENTGLMLGLGLSSVSSFTWWSRLLSSRRSVCVSSWCSPAWQVHGARQESWTEGSLVERRLCVAYILVELC